MNLKISSYDAINLIFYSKSNLNKLIELVMFAKTQLIKGYRYRNFESLCQNFDISKERKTKY